MTAAPIAAALGGAHRSGGWWRCVCQVHGSRTGRSSTLALRDGDRTLIVKCWARCHPRDVFTELRRQELITDDLAASLAPPVPRGTNSDDAARRLDFARSIWGHAQGVRGSPASAHLAGRGITIEPPPCLRWAPALRRPDGSHGPAMIARIDAIGGALIGIARTWLIRDASSVWRRRDRAMLGRAAGGGVRLPNAAKTAVQKAAARWLAEGRCVRIAMPPEPGTDMADVPAGRGCARIVEAYYAAA
jgi:hypothetical protein